MKKDLEKTFDKFLNVSEDEACEKNNKDKKAVVLHEREGLIERFDPIILVDKSGRQLLREQY